MDAKLAVDLSRQWRNGAPASTLKAAGVLLHVIDGGMGGIFHNGFANSSTGLPPPPEWTPYASRSAWPLAASSSRPP